MLVQGENPLSAGRRLGFEGSRRQGQVELQAIAEMGLRENRDVFLPETVPELRTNASQLFMDLSTYPAECSYVRMALHEFLNVPVLDSFGVADDPRPMVNWVIPVSEDSVAYVDLLGQDPEPFLAAQVPSTIARESAGVVGNSLSAEELAAAKQEEVVRMWRV